MSDSRLRTVLREFLADLRAAGRGASSITIERIVANRLPALAVAADAHADANLADSDQERIVRAMSLRARELHAASLNGRAHGSLRSWQRATQPRPAARHWSLGLGLAGAAALVLVGWLLYSALNKPVMVKHKPKSGNSVPLPKGPEKRPDGPVVKGGTPPKKDLAPRTGPRKQESVVAAKQPEIGKLESVMGEPLVYAAGSKMGIVAKPGMKVAMGSVVETGDADKLELKFTDGTTLRLDFNTRVAIPASDIAHRASPIARPASIRLDGGRLYAMVTHQEEGEHFKVETPAATAEVIGTEFGLKVERLAKKPSGPDYKATLQVKRGKVRFYNSLGERTATDRTESWATEDSGPTEPKRISTLRIVQLSGSHRWSITTARLTESEALRALAGPIGWTGLTLRDDPAGGVLVAGVDPRSPGAIAGIQPTDRLLRVDGAAAATATAVERVLCSLPGLAHRLTLVRDGRSLELSLRAGTISPYSGRWAERLRVASLQGVANPGQQGMSGLARMAAETNLPEALNNLGVAWERADRMGEAIRCYRRAAARDPRNSLYRLNLSRALVKIGNFARSAEEARIAIRLSPNVSRAQVELVRILQDCDLAEEAIATADRFLARFGPSSKLLNRKSSSQLRLGRQEEALANSLRATQLGPLDAGAWAVLGDVYHDLKDLKQAESCLRRAVAIDPGLVAYLGNLGAVLCDQWKHAEAEPLFRRAIALDPEKPGSWSALGIALQFQGKTKEAEEAYRRAIKLDPGLEVANANLGIMLRSIGRLNDAIEHLLKFVALTPDSAATHSELGVLMRMTGKPVEAERHARTAVKLEPTHWGYRVTLANVLMEVGRASEAHEECLRALELAPKEPLVYNAYGRALRDLGKLDQAIRAYRDGLAFDPQNAFILRNLGSLQVDLGRFSETEGILRKAVEVEPTSEPGLERLAYCLYTLGKTTESIEVYTRLIKVATSNQAVVWARLGMVLSAAGRHVEAEAACRRAVQIDPTNQEAMRRLATTLAEGGVKLDEALRLFMPIVKDNPNDPWLQKEMAVIRLARNELPEAEKAFRMAVELSGNNPQSYDAWHQLAGVQAKAGKARSELETWLLHISMDASCRFAPAALKRLVPDEDERKVLAEAAKSGLPTAWFRLGEQRLKKAAYPQAIEALLRAAELDPKARWHWESLGRAYEALGQIEKAKDAYSKAVEVDPKAPWNWQALGRAYEALGQLGNAKEAYAKALSAADPKPWVIYAYCKVCYDLKQNDEAEKVWRKAIERDSNNAILLSNTAWLLTLYDQHPDEALKLALKALELVPNDDNVDSNVGAAYFRLGDYPNAEKYLVKSLVGTELGKTKDPEVALAWAWLGLIYEKTGRKDNAIETFKIALQLDPKEPTALEGLKRLGG